MRIAALTVHGEGGWPALQFISVPHGLSCLYGPSGSGKSTIAEFLGHLLYGKPPLRRSRSGAIPEGEAVIDSPNGSFRLRRYRDGSPNGRLTVASLDLSPVDEHTVAKLLGDFAPSVLARHLAVDFSESLSAPELSAGEVACELHTFESRGSARRRRANELAARRDTLARELETRIAAERRASGDLDGRLRVLDRLIRDEQRETDALDERLRAIETALAETDARLRYRRLELNSELRWNATQADDLEPELADLDGQVARWRTILAELADREKAMRGKLAQVRPGDSASEPVVTDQRAWLAVARQLTADLEGEIARLARASASNECMCRDAHPRLRPIVETAQRQLDVLESLIVEQDRSLQAAAYQQEIEQLTRSQAEMRRQLEHLLDRREALTRAAKPSRRLLAAERSDDRQHGVPIQFSAADAEQLEERRLELEQDRFDLLERLRTRQRQLRDLSAGRAEAERERAALLSARSIEHVQRELADVQRRLQRVAGGRAEFSTRTARHELQRAADYFAQLTDGRYAGLELEDNDRPMRVVSRSGAVLDAASLSLAERDQLRLSVSLALAAQAARQGVPLPLVLDDPFARLDASGTAALAAVLDHFGRQGQQALIFTARRDAAERVASLGATVRDIVNLRRPSQEAVSRLAEPIFVRDESTAVRSDRVKTKSARRKTKSTRKRTSDAGHSDAA